MLQTEPVRYGCPGKRLPQRLCAIKRQKHLLSIQNNDSYCLLYVIAAGLFGNKIKDPTNPNDEFYKKFIKLLNLKDSQGNPFNFPITIPEIKVFLKQNPELNIQLNIFQHFKKVCCLYFLTIQQIIITQRYIIYFI